MSHVVNIIYYVCLHIKALLNDILLEKNRSSSPEAKEHMTKYASSESIYCVLLKPNSIQIDFL